MIARTIAWCVANRLPVFVGAAALGVWGVVAIGQTPFDALPDLSDVQIIVSTDWPGRSPDLIEAQVTYPIVTTLVSAPKVRAVRGVSDFGVSFVHVVFEDSTEMYWARDRVLERLETLRDRLPAGVSPTMGPEATGVGWVFQYALVDRSGTHSLDELRSLQDWIIRPGLTSVAGVAEIASIGGFVKQYQVNLDPNRLSSLNLSVNQVVDAIRASNNDVEGRVLEFAGREYMVRARGRLTSARDIELIALGVGAGGTPLQIGDVAEVRVGPDIRRGIAELDGTGEAVGGIVIMRVGENALGVIERVKERLAEIQKTLPETVVFVPVYDRSDLIRGSVATLRRVLVEEVVVVSLVVVVFLFHLRFALVPLLVLPIAVLACFIPLSPLGLSANIMSLGGIALAIGVLVDAAIVMVENGYRRLVEEPLAAKTGTNAVLEAAYQVGRPVFFSLAIIVVSFVPVFLLESQEGRMFRPLALTKTVGAAAATLLAITLVPALMALLLPGAGRGEAKSNWIVRACASVYEPVLRLALRRKWTCLVLNGAVIPLTALLVPSLGHEFMPPFFEGSLLYMPTAPAGLSVTEATRLLQTQDLVLRGIPEVERVFGTVGRATTATDNSPMSMVNTTITLKPRDQWRPGLTLQALHAEMDRSLEIPGVPNVWTQPIRGRLDMLFTGIKSPVGIKVLGSDVTVIQELGRQVETVLRSLPGTRSAYAERTSEGSYADIRIDREAIGRFGLTVQDVEEIVQAAIGGANIGQTVEGRERYPINVRYQYDFRADLQALERVLVKAPTGAQVPLGQLSTVVLTTGPSMIRDENGELAGYVYVDTTADSDIGGYVARARAALASQVKLPPGYRLDWSGQYELQVRAWARLRIVVPLAILAIFILLFWAFRSASEALIVMLSVVYAMTGGIVLQWLLGYNFSVAVWVGYIALFGLAVQTGVIMVVYLQQALEQRLRTSATLSEDDIREATVAGAVLRLRPKLMTVAATVMGLLPILWADGVGVDVLKPVAVPMVGGMITSTVHVLIITPVIFFRMKLRAHRLTVAECRAAAAATFRDSAG
jgi:Cu(I)/Ag(I) efflux system membrane protein CusA/SilA